MWLRLFEVAAWWTMPFMSRYKLSIPGIVNGSASWLIIGYLSDSQRWNFGMPIFIVILGKQKLKWEVIIN